MGQATQTIDFVRVLGKPGFFQGEQEVSSSLSRKTRALAVYLCARRSPQRRHLLADMFCAQANDPIGSLRWHLSRIRKALGGQWVQTQDDAVSIDFGDHLDLTRFEQALQGDLKEADDTVLHEALELYKGELLEGLVLTDAPDFEIWLLGERNRLRMLYERGLIELMNRRIAQGAHQEAISLAQRLVQSDPLREETHAVLIWLYAANGQKEAAGKQYEMCRELLEKELGVAPLEETQALYQQAMEGDFSPEAATLLTRGFAGVSPAQTEAAVASDFVGRTKELEGLARAWSLATQGKRQVVLLASEMGGGKTRLVEEFVTHQQELRLWVGRCYESERTFPYHPWQAILGELAASLEDDDLERQPAFVLEQLIRLLPGLGQRLSRPVAAPPPTSGNELDHFYAALKIFLFQTHQQTPQLLFFDDLQWADDASLRLLHYLMRSSAQEKLLFVGAFSSEEASASPSLQAFLRDLKRSALGQRFSLAPLGAEELTQLVEQHCPSLPQTQQDQACRLLLDATGGKPFYVMEALREWGDELGNMQRLPVSENLQSFIFRQLDRLTPRERQILEAIAIFETPVTFLQAQLASARSEEETMLSIEDGLRRGLLQSLSVGVEPTYHFHQKLVREAVLEQLSPIRRQLLHRRAAMALEQTGGKPSALAHHWHFAGVPAKEAHYAILAGELAASFFAIEEALRYFQSAAELIEDKERAVEVLRRMGELQQLVGEWEEAQTFFVRATKEAEKLQRLPLMAQCQMSLGRFLLVRGEYDEAIEQLKQAEDTFTRQEDLVGVCQTLGGMGRAYRQQGKFAQASTCYERKMESAKTLQESAAVRNRLIRESLGALGVIALQQGDFQRAFACFEETLKMTVKGADVDDEEELSRMTLEEDGQFTLSKIMGHGAFFAGHEDQYTEALSFFEQQLEGEDEAEDGMSRGKELSNLSAMYTWMGDHARALSFVQRHFTLAFGQGSLPGLNKVMSNMGEIYRYMGDFDKARVCYEYKLSLALDLGERRGIATALGRLAQIFGQLDDLDKAHQLIDKAIELARLYELRSDLCRFLHTQAELYTREDSLAKAVTTAEEAHALAEAAKLEGIALETSLLLHRLRAQQTPANIASSCATLEDKLQSEDSTATQARLHDTLVALYEMAEEHDKAEEHRTQAATRYAQLYQSTPHSLYAQRHEALTGTSLPQPQELLALPTMLKNFSFSLKRQLKRVDKLL